MKKICPRLLVVDKLIVKEGFLSRHQNHKTENLQSLYLFSKNKKP